MFEEKSYCYFSPSPFDSSAFLSSLNMDVLKNITPQSNSSEAVVNHHSFESHHHFNQDIKHSNFVRFLINDFWITDGDSRVINYPLLDGGIQKLMAIMAIYFLFVTVVGPIMMSRRKPFELRGPMMAYNVTMVALNAYFFCKYIAWCDYGREFLKTDFPSKFDKDFRTMLIIDVTYYYFLTKFIDLLDTVFFVLRKKNNQITALHLYHHTIVPILGWIGLKISPMAPAYQLFAILNSLVHVIMYSYYALSALGPKMQPYLWWKKYLTLIQLIQFVILINYGVALATVQNNYPRVWFWIVFFQGPLFFMMFFDFYRASYKRPNRTQKNAMAEKKAE